MLLFYMILMKILTSYEPPDLDMMSYVTNSGGYGHYELKVLPMPEE